MAAYFTGFIHAVVVASSSLNWSYIMALDCFVIIEDAIGKGDLVLAVYFY